VTGLLSPSEVRAAAIHAWRTEWRHSCACAVEELELRAEATGLECAKHHGCRIYRREVQR